ncbi:MAG: methyl-accepting chemotaxis protein [Rhodocyclaceae bacterium]
MKLSLRAKLIGVILALATLITVAITLGGYLEMRHQIIDAGIKKEVSTAAAGTTQLIHQWMATRKNIVTAGAQRIENGDVALPVIVQIARSGDFEAAYLGTPDKQMITDHDMQLPAGYDPTGRPWYKDYADSKGTSMTAPYVDMSTHKLVLSFVAPISLNGAFAGVIGTDVLLDDIVANVLSLKLVGNGYAMLVTRDGQVLVHRDAARVTHPLGDIVEGATPQWLADLAASGEMREARIGGTAHFLYARAIEGSDMLLVTAIDKGVALSPLGTLLWQAAAVLAVVILIVVPLAGLLVNRSLRSIRHIHDTMVDIANGGGDLTHKIAIDGNDEVAETADAFNRFLDQLRGMFQRIQTESGHLTEGVNEINGVLEQLSDDSQRLADLTSQNAAAIEQITVSIAHIADNSHDANTLVKATDTLSLDSMATVRNVASQVGQSASEVHSLSTVLDDLAQRSQDISGIIRVIREIAEQTNLLALNAAIEAARAGEQGRGFAVVADEVRKLAERTGQATLQITDMIDGVRAETARAVESMQQTQGSVVDGAHHANNAAGKITTIRENMNAVVVKIEEIALSTQEQLSATTSMAQAAEQITHQTQHSDSALRHATEEVRRLNELATNLRGLFNHFTI